eukprot:gene5947-5767_t
MASRSTFVLNCTLPPNVLAAVAVPVPGLASPIVTEGGAVVWKAGSFVPGVGGVTRAHAGKNGPTVVFAVGSGSYNLVLHSFATSTAAAAGDRSRTVSGCGGRLRCPSGTTISHIVRAGLADAGSPATDRMAPMRRRFLAGVWNLRSDIGTSRTTSSPPLIGGGAAPDEGGGGNVWGRQGSGNARKRAETPGNARKRAETPGNARKREETRGDARILVPSTALVTHALERQCRGRVGCELDVAAVSRAVNPAVALGGLDDGGSALCAVVVCRGDE